jgi:2-polyprenyl-3-methyl-5-hydroxy-6-metoxy-1,4-benzoquinol methylase
MKEKFIKFAIVGGVGAVINIFFTFCFTQFFHIWYIFSLILATAIAMVCNFYLNNSWTFTTQKSCTEPDYDWDAYYNGNPLQKWWKQKIAQKVVAMVEGQYLFDFGCGSSPMCTLLNGQSYHAVDGNAAKVQYMNEKNMPNRKFAQITMDDFEMMAINKKLPEYDTTMAIEVIEHMPNMHKAQILMNCLSRATVKGGSVIIATPNYDSIIWRNLEKLYGIIMYKSYAFDHTTKLNEDKMADLGRNAGLILEETDSILGADMVLKFRKVTDVVLV